jgi:hypothetical protein
MHRLDIKQAEASLIAPVEKLRDRPVVGAARVRVTDVGGEEFDEAATLSCVRHVEGIQHSNLNAAFFGARASERAPKPRKAPAGLHAEAG